MDNSSWPKTADGVIDWEAAFEDPADGLISLISKAKSAHDLRHCTLVVIENLYPRNDDPTEVERFVAEINALLPDDTPRQALPKITDSVVSILRRIKEGRIEKASSLERQGEENMLPYTTTSAAKKRKRRRRRKKASETTGFFGLPSLYVYAVLGVVFAGAIGMTAMSFFNATPDDGMEARSMAFIDQMKATVSADPPERNAFGGKISVGVRSGRRFIKADNIPAKSCESAAWVFLNRGIVVINDAQPTRISPSILREFCAKNGAYASITWYPKSPKK